MRFENLADSFDVTRKASLAEVDLSQEVNVTEFARKLYGEVNGKSPTSVDIKETDIQGVHAVS